MDPLTVCSQEILFIGEQELKRIVWKIWLGREISLKSQSEVSSTLR